MPAPVLSLQGITLTFGGHALLEGADLSVSPGERLCLIGRNGSGKSTLLKIAAGEIEPDSGARFAQPGASIRYLPQEPDLSGHANVQDYAAAGLGADGNPARVRMLLHELGLTGAEKPDNLSGGEARRAALARALAPEPDILLLDEPTNHLDLKAIEWLEAELMSLSSAMVIISHDRRFLQNLSRASVWLDRGRTRRLEKGFAEFEAWRDLVLEEEELNQHKLERQIVREEHWMRYGVTARRKRNMRRVAELAGLRRQARESRKAAGQVRMSAAEGRVSGKLVIEAERISKTYEDRAVVKDFSIRIMREDRVGIAGPNGAGKTTLINLLTGALQPDSGAARLGASLEMASLDQKRAALGADVTLQEALTGGGGDWVEINGEKKHVIGYMRDFLFAPAQARMPVMRLSGGERGRLALARALSLPSNLLVLDEPTNDLDLETLDLLQETIAGYPGTVIIVSHDRDFLDRVATSVIMPEGGGRWQEYAGGYSDMLAQRAGAEPREARAAVKRQPAESAPAPAQPRRKLSFKEKHALETLPGHIEALQGEKARLSETLSAPGAYGRDAAGFAKTSARLGAIDAEIAALEEQWLALEMRREEIEG